MPGPEVHRAMIAAWADFAEDGSVDVAILTGAGDDAFCAGADLKTYIPPIIAGGKPSDLRQIAELGLNGFTRGMHRISKPIVGASTPREEMAEWCGGEVTWRADDLAVVRATYA